MNEAQLIRTQLSLERTHASTVAAACAAAAARRAHDVSGDPTADFVQACVEYLACVLAWFEERDQRAGDLAQRLRLGEHSGRRALEEALARSGRSRETLERLERAVEAGRASRAGPEAPGLWQEFARYFADLWRTRRDAIDTVLAARLRAADWRVVAGIDADAILEERRRYARVRATLPQGVSLAEAAAVAEPSPPAAR